MNIKQLLLKIDELITNQDNKLKNITVSGWIRTSRTSSGTQTFCVINDGSDVSGLQLIVTTENMSEEKFMTFNNNARIGCFINVSGKIKECPLKEIKDENNEAKKQERSQKYELIVNDFTINGHNDNNYPLAKSKMNLDTLRKYIHLRPRTNTFGSILRVRSKLMKAIHDFYHQLDFLHIDPNIITVNECEGGAGVFQVTEKDITKKENLKYKADGTYNWEIDHFKKPVYLTVSSQLQLEMFACSLGNVYTVNKSFRSEHSKTSKHCSEFTHIEIEILSDDMTQLMLIGETMIRYCIKTVMIELRQDIENLDKIEKFNLGKNNTVGLLDRLNILLETNFIMKTYTEIIEEINTDIKEKKLKFKKLEIGDDLGSEYENYITAKYNTGVFCTHWPLEIKSFYMKQCDGNNLCESFDLLLPFGIGELIGGSMREENYEKLIENMNNKNVDQKPLEFYTDLRKYGTCPHGGFGLGFDRLLMLLTGMKNIRDVQPIPVCYEECEY